MLFSFPRKWEHAFRLVLSFSHEAMRLTQAFPGGGWNLVWSRPGTSSACRACCMSISPAYDHRLF
jgi:hypothetical protein